MQGEQKFEANLPFHGRETPFQANRRDVFFPAFERKLKPRVIGKWYLAGSLTAPECIPTLVPTPILFVTCFQLQAYFTSTLGVKAKSGAGYRPICQEHSKETCVFPSLITRLLKEL